MAQSPTRFRLSRPGQAGVAAVALLAVGGTAGAVAGHHLRPAVEMAPVRPVAIQSLASQSGIVTIRGQVLEVYGNKFVAGDNSGRALVDLGRGGDDAALVAQGQTVSVQGRFDHSVLHASFLVDASNHVVALGPIGGPPHRGPGGPHGPGGHGPDDRDGPDGASMTPPPPPSAAAGQAQPAPAAPTQTAQPRG